jgi:DNA-binding HxlR family transcriptional regulator
MRIELTFMGRYAQRHAPALDRLSPQLTKLLKVVSARWSILVLDGLATGHVRFNALHRHLAGINHKVLIETLRMLEAYGFVQGPMRAGESRPDGDLMLEYRLTPAGLELLDWVTAARQRAEQWPLSRHDLDGESVVTSSAQR